jgi:opacity protein-like surface antigen
MKKLILGLTAASCIASSSLAHNHSIRVDSKLGYSSDSENWHAPIFLGAGYSSYLHDNVRLDVSGDTFIYAFDKESRNEEKKAWMISVSHNLLFEGNISSNFSAFAGGGVKLYGLLDPASSILDVDSLNKIKQSGIDYTNGLFLGLISFGPEGGVSYNFDNNVGLEAAIRYDYYLNETYRNQAIPHNFTGRLSVKYSW